MKLLAHIVARPLDGGAPFPIEVGSAPVRFGRDRRADVCVPDYRVSKDHAVMQLQPSGALWLFDQGSTNGTYVNKRKVKANVPVPVEKGTEIAFADAPGFIIEDITVEPSTSKPRVRDTAQQVVPHVHFPEYPPAASPSAFADGLEGVSYREGNEPPEEPEKSTSQILEAHRGMASNEAWEKRQASESAIAEAWELFHENIEFLLGQHPGKLVAIQDRKLIVGDSTELLTSMLDVERPHIIIPIKRFPRDSESP